MKDPAKKFRQRQNKKKARQGKIEVVDVPRKQELIHETRSLLCDWNDDVYLAKVWRVIWSDMEYMAIAWRKREDSHWQFRQRYRIDAGGDDPFDDADPKFISSGVLEDMTEDELCALVDTGVDELVQLAGGTKAHIDVHAWGWEGAKKFTEQDGVHLKMFTKGGES